MDLQLLVLLLAASALLFLYTFYFIRFLKKKKPLIGLIVLGVGFGVLCSSIVVGGFESMIFGFIGIIIMSAGLFWSMMYSSKITA